MDHKDGPGLQADACTVRTTGEGGAGVRVDPHGWPWTPS
jgi:hypothetical protein